MSENVIERMTQALDLEIQAIKKRGSSNSIELRGGEFRGTAEGNAIYAFPIDQDVRLREESPIRVIAGKDEVDGVVVSYNEGLLLVALECDLGPKIAFARLVADDSFLVERLKKKLEEAADDTKSFNQERADQAIGERASASADDSVDPRLLLTGELNREQITAVSRATGSDVTYVWGPPGTGKTTAIGAIVEAYYRRGLSVLLVSNTNIAVDTALEKTADRLKADVGFNEGQVLRYGPIVKDELRDKYGHLVSLDDVVARLGESLAAERARLEEERCALQQESSSIREAVAKLEQLEDARQRVERFRSAVGEMTAKLTANQVEIDTLGRKLLTLRSKQERAESMNSIRRLFAGLNIDQLKTDNAATERRLIATRSARSSIESELGQLGEKLTQSEAEVSSLEARGLDVARLVDLRAKLAPLDQRMDTCRKRLGEIDRELETLREEILRNCKVLATTVYRTYLKGQIQRTFDAVVIDEASMLALPMVYFAAGLATRHVVIAGDFRQLPPIVMSDEPAVLEWVKQDAFMKAGIVAAVDQRQPPPSLVQLRVQYRMDPRICAVVNQVFYDNRLETAPTVSSRSKKPFPYGSSALFFVDTGPEHPWTSQKIGTFSRYNVLHALLVCNLARRLKIDGYLDADDMPNEALGVVSPYAAQTALIERVLEEHLDRRGTKFALTVHRFQGNEKDTMLVDLSDSLGARPSKFIRATSVEEDGARLLNVALSRARDHVVLVANFSYLREKVSPDGVVARVLDIFERAGERLDVRDLVAFAPEDWSKALEPLTAPTIVFDPSISCAFTEATFYPTFARDIQAATESIVVFSPFLTPNGSARWADLLRSKVTQGVRVRLVVRPPGDQGGVLERGLQELIDQLAGTGIVVDLRRSMHEKFAIIDAKILWHGSLNILSHRDTSESMLRIPSPSASEAMARFIVAPKRGLSKDEPDVDLAVKENPDCPDCGSAMVLCNGRYGIYFECSQKCGGKIDPRRSLRQLERRSGRPTRASGRVETAAARDCPQCGSRLVTRKGRFGQFWGCTGYPKCRYTASA